MSAAEITRRQEERAAGYPNLKKGHTLQQRTGHHTGVGWDSIDETDGSVEVNVLGQEKVVPGTYGPGNTAPPREVAEEIYGMMWKWAQKSRENFALMAKIVRHNNPLSFGHLTDEDLAAKIEGHAKDAARAATEKVYQARKWDRGNVIGGT